MCVSKILFSAINKFTYSSANSGYLQALWQGVCALAVFGLVALISGDNADLLSSADDAFGKIGLRTCGFAVTILLIAEAGAMLKIYTDVIASIALPRSSEFLISLAIVGASATLVFFGIPPLFAYCRGSGIILLVALAVICALNIPNCNISEVFPVFGNGIKNILKINGLEIYADMLTVFLIVPHLKSEKDAAKIGIKSIIISTIAITSATFIYVLSVPYPASTLFSLPILEIASAVKLDVLFQRAEGVFLFLWIFTGFILTSIYISLSTETFRRSFAITDRRAITPIFAFLALCTAQTLKSPSESGIIYDRFYIFGAILFLFLTLTVFITKRIKENI